MSHVQINLLSSCFAGSICIRFRQQVRRCFSDNTVLAGYSGKGKAAQSDRSDSDNNYFHTYAERTVSVISVHGDYRYRSSLS